MRPTIDQQPAVQRLRPGNIRTGRQEGCRQTPVVNVSAEKYRQFAIDAPLPP
jgi:hypothetical protein